MPRRKRTLGGYRSPPIQRQMLGAKETVETGIAGKERYAREYGTRGIIRMELFQELIQPYISAIKVNPDLGSEQKAIGVKEFFRRWREGLNAYSMSVLAESLRYASALVIAVPTSPTKPTMGMEGGWYV